jgi:putative pyruvate formate lyase activating enzyme
MLALEAQGVHHIGLVSPTHQARGAAETLRIAKTRGLRAPVIYNTNAYDTVVQLSRLEGLVEIYLPDLKYASDAMAWEISRCRDYTARARTAIQEMFRQVGHLTVGLDGLATRGLLVRLLVLPGGLAGIARSLRFLAEEISPDLWLSLMAQYEPSHVTASGNAAILERYPELGRRLTRTEYDDALELARMYGFHRYFTQDPETAPAYGNPAFTRPEPFIWEHAR